MFSTSTGTRAADRDERDASDLVALRRNVWLSGVVAGLALLIGVAYLLRGSALGTVVGVVLLVVAAVNALGVSAARTPVLVADQHGIRLRVGLTWRGLPWGSVRQVVVEHADHPLREGRLVIVPRDASAAMDHLGPNGRLHLRWNQLWYGAALSIPLGMTTLTDTADLGAALADLAGGRTDVVQLRGRQRAQLDDVPARAESLEEADPVEDVPDEPVDPFVETPVAVAPLPAVDEPPADVWDELPPPPEDDLSEDELPAPVAPLRSLHHPTRVEVRLEPSATPFDEASNGLVPSQRSPEEREHTVEVPDLEHADAWEEVPVDVETDDLSVRPPTDHDDELPPPVELRPAPVIGPRIAHAREMLDMSIEELSERTMIRPHVLEAIEVDDFGPCGGDFYARGHLTAIARVLGLKSESLMQDYDERYAGGPINARRVFEAELATGLGGGMRATRGGSQWTMLIALVLCLTMVWGVARLLTGSPEQVAAPSGDSTAGLAANRQPITSPLMKTTRMKVTAAHAGTHVVVKDRTGRVLWSGDLRMGQHRQVVGLAPFRVEADNAGAVEVAVAGKARGTVGTAGQAGTKKFR
jgi:hypothetical protein